MSRLVKGAAARGMRARFDPYIIAGVCLLIAAAALRFYDLPGEGLSYDEGRAANNSRGAFSEILRNTRYENSSPKIGRAHV